MRQIITILLCLFFSNLTFGQDKNYLKPAIDSANKMIASSWGQKNLENYIVLDKKRSKYLGKEIDVKVSFSEDILFSPDLLFFAYNVIHPAFRGDTARIEFILDSAGQLASRPKGLYQIIGSLDNLNTIKKETAVSYAKRLGLLKGKGNWKVTLQWIEANLDTLALKPNYTFQDFVRGYFCWAVESTFAEPYQQGCFIYSARVYYFDIITGKLIDKKNI